MFSLSIFLGNASLALLFTNSEKAEAANSQIVAAAPGQTFELNDDFGHKLTMLRSSIHGWLLEDMNKSALAHQERALHEAKIKMSIQKAAQTHLGLREAFRPPSALPIVSPMGNGQFR